MFYFVRTPGWFKKVFPGRIWEMEPEGKSIFFSFDDGPHPEETLFVLEQLRAYNAKATFFCVGNNVKDFPEVYQQIIDGGHSVGNHTFQHLNGWKSRDGAYLADISLAKKYIDSNLFRPPYGRISRFQQERLGDEKFNLKTVMWTVLSGDFDTSITGDQCVENVVLNARPGSIVVFHDSAKASPLLRYALPKLLKYFSEEGYRFERIEAPLK
ncbi:MAG: polysaccharide deacetylase [Ferruginibacter sp.]|nr:polysaccharide deacetylase [Ferruginibacter sp.]